MTIEEAIKYAEAMKAKVHEKIEFFRLGHTHAPEVHYSDLAFLSAAISALREQEERRWIPVTERLPEIGQKCLIANREIVVRGWLRPDGVWKTGVSSDELWSKFSLYQPTHWMPLPEPPKEAINQDHN